MVNPPAHDFLTYYGVCSEFPNSPHIGDVITKDLSEYVFDGKEWQLIGNTATLGYSQMKRMEIHGINKCKSCGAPLPVPDIFSRYVTCEYCGTTWDAYEN